MSIALFLSEDKPQQAAALVVLMAPAWTGASSADKVCSINRGLAQGLKFLGEGADEQIMDRLDKKKQRGQWRKLETMFENIDRFVPYSEKAEAYEHFHVPSDQFIQRKKTSGRVKTAFCRKWLETTERYISQKPANLPFCKVVAALAVPNYWDSQIIIFYDKAYYDSFWTRNNSGQIWTFVETPAQSLKKARNIRTVLREVCCHEVLADFEEVAEQDIWFYGDLPNDVP